jgi:O-antigen ligase
MFFWYLRDKMKFVRWGLGLSIIILHIMMEAPVWFIFDRISNIFGGSGWHRAFLIDQAISHFKDWWFIGVKYTAHWFPYGLMLDPDQTDITNTYVKMGVNGGLITLILFVLIIVQCFKALGIAEKKENHHSIEKQFFIWAIGISLFSHVISFLSITYFDQNIIYWYLLLAIISVLLNLNKNPVCDPNGYLIEA